jgi:hypothetical protein
MVGVEVNTTAGRRRSCDDLCAVPHASHPEARQTPRDPTVGQSAAQETPPRCAQSSCRTYLPLLCVISETAVIAVEVNPTAGRRRSCDDLCAVPNASHPAARRRRGTPQSDKAPRKKRFRDARSHRAEHICPCFCVILERLRGPSSSARLGTTHIYALRNTARI